MKQGDKELLLKDLSSRLPYGVILNCCNSIGEKLTSIDKNGLINHDYDIDEVKPYLFPLSSMTDVERQCYKTMSRGYTVIQQTVFFDWLNKKMFDYRGLIPMGLAIDCTNLNIY